MTFEELRKRRWAWANAAIPPIGMGSWTDKDVEWFIDAAAAAEREYNTNLVNTLQAIKGMLYRFLGHSHWDRTMRHGAGCELCEEQRAVKKEIEELIAAALRRQP